MQHGLHRGIGRSESELASTHGQKQGQHHIDEGQVGWIGSGRCGFRRERIDSWRDKWAHIEPHVIAQVRLRGGVSQGDAALRGPGHSRLGDLGLPGHIDFWMIAQILPNARHVLDHLNAVALQVLCRPHPR